MPTVPPRVSEPDLAPRLNLKVWQAGTVHPTVTSC